MGRKKRTKWSWSFTNFTDNTGAATVGGDNLFTAGTLKLNGQERAASRGTEYFNWVQPYQYHSGVPLRGVNVYKFALKPEEHQPSGTSISQELIMLH